MPSSPGTLKGSAALGSSALLDTSRGLVDTRVDTSLPDRSVASSLLPRTLVGSPRAPVARGAAVIIFGRGRFAESACGDRLSRVPNWIDSSREDKIGLLYLKLLGLDPNRRWGGRAGPGAIPIQDFYSLRSRVPFDHEAGHKRRPQAARVAATPRPVTSAGRKGDPPAAHEE